MLFRASSVDFPSIRHDFVLRITCVWALGQPHESILAFSVVIPVPVPRFLPERQHIGHRRM